MKADKYLPEKVSWFRLPEYLKNLISRVESIENQEPQEFNQVNSDWNSESGVSEILNKPNLDLYGASVIFSERVNNVPFSINQNLNSFSKNRTIQLITADGLNPTSQFNYNINVMVGARDGMEVLLSIGTTLPSVSVTSNLNIVGAGSITNQELTQGTTLLYIYDLNNNRIVRVY